MQVEHRAPVPPCRDARPYAPSMKRGLRRLGTVGVAIALPRRKCELRRLRAPSRRSVTADPPDLSVRSRSNGGSADAITQPPAGHRPDRTSRIRRPPSRNVRTVTKCPDRPDKSGHVTNERDAPRVGGRDGGQRPEDGSDRASATRSLASASRWIVVTAADRARRIATPPMTGSWLRPRDRRQRLRRHRTHRITGRRATDHRRVVGSTAHGSSPESWLRPAHSSWRSG